MTTLSERAKERGTYAITVVPKDETGTAVAPTAAVWDLTDEDGTVINSRSSVSCTSLSTSMVVILSGADLAISDDEELKRIFTIRYTYNSSYGTGLPGRDEVALFIENLNIVT